MGTPKMVSTPTVGTVLIFMGTFVRCDHQYPLPVFRVPLRWLQSPVMKTRKKVSTPNGCGIFEVLFSPGKKVEGLEMSFQVLDLWRPHTWTQGCILSACLTLTTSQQVRSPWQWAGAGGSTWFSLMRASLTMSFSSERHSQQHLVAPASLQPVERSKTVIPLEYFPSSSCPYHRKYHWPVRPSWKAHVWVIFSYFSCFCCLCWQRTCHGGVLQPNFFKISFSDPASLALS